MLHQGNASDRCSNGKANHQGSKDDKDRGVQGHGITTSSGTDWSEVRSYDHIPLATDRMIATDHLSTITNWIAAFASAQHAAKKHR
jgi:hypothetical protein